MISVKVWQWAAPWLTIIALVVLCLPALHPFMQGQMLLTDDGLLHLYRSVALDHSWRADSFPWPRYSSSLVFGYGAPLFNFFPPTSYMPTAILHQLGLSFVDAWLGTMMLYIVLAALGAYGLGAQWAGKMGGFVTAAAYVYAPYFAFDTVTRGTSSEVSALALLPFALWGFTRLAHSGTRRDFSLAVLAFALFVPMHNIITLHGTALLGAYCLFLSWTSPRRWQTFTQLLSAGLLALLMTAFFWLPALGETDHVKINNVAGALGAIDVTRSLRPLSEIVALPKTADPTQLQPETPITLGWPQIILAMIGTWLAWRKRGSGVRGLMSLLAALTVGTIALQMPFAAWAWEHIPLIGLSQFAWRIMGLPSLTVALMAGVGAHLLLRNIAPQRAQIAVLSGFVALMVMYAMPWLYTPYIAPQADSIRDAHAYERRTGELTLSSYSEYVPVWTAVVPDPDAIAPFAAAGTPIPRLRPSSDVRVWSADWGGTWGTLHLSAQQATTLVFNWLYVPGWQARFLDAPKSNVPLTVRPQSETGLVTIEVPAGDHRIELALYSTPLQRGSHILSVVGLGVLYLVLVNGWRFWGTFTRAALPAALPAHAIWGAVILTGMALFLGKTLIVDRVQNPIRAERFAYGIEAGADIALQADLGGLITLLGVNMPAQVESGAAGEIELFWALSGAPVAADYASIVHLRDAAGTLIAEASAQYPGNLATSNWLPGFYLRDRLSLAIPPGTPPGTYTLDAGLFSPETGQRLDVLNAAGNPVDVRVLLGHVEIIRPDTLAQDWPDALATLAGVELLDFSGVPDAAQVGTELTLAWVWRALAAGATDAEARLIWIDNAGDIQGASPFVPLTVAHPTSQWQAGDVWRGVHLLYLPGDLAAGEYRVGIELGGERYIAGMMRVTTPERVFTSPGRQHQVDVRWQNGIALLGYDVREAGLSLDWQTTQPLNENLHLFVHVLAADERIIAQTDGVPADWSRPTTGWARGEIITTQHDFGGLNLSDYRIRVGWYEPRSGARISLDDGDAWQLTIESDAQ